MPAKTLAEAFVQARNLDAPLGERLGSYARSVRELHPPLAQAVDRLVERLDRAKAAVAAPKEGDFMPPFLLPDHTGRFVSLEGLVRQGPVAITFARGHWCPYCRIAVSALADVAGDAEAVGARIVAIVPDRQPFAAKLRAEANAPFPILTDIHNGYALSLGLVYWLGAEVQELMRQHDYDLAKSQGNDSWFVPVPATFVVGRNGRVTRRHVDPDYRKRIEVDAVLEALTAAAGHR